jgi:hypothetical protein
MTLQEAGEELKCTPKLGKVFASFLAQRTGPEGDCRSSSE